MKKIIGAISLILATTTFSQEIPEGSKNMNEMKIGVYKSTIMVEERQQEFIMPGVVTQENIVKAEKLVKNYKVKQEILELDIEKINIRINQEMLYENPSQRAINRLIDDKVKIYGMLEKNKVDMSFQMLKLKDETAKENI